MDPRARTTSHLLLGFNHCPTPSRSRESSWNDFNQWLATMTFHGIVTSRLGFSFLSKNMKTSSISSSNGSHSGVCEEIDSHSTPPWQRRLRPSPPLQSVLRHIMDRCCTMSCSPSQWPSHPTPGSSFSKRGGCSSKKLKNISSTNCKHLH